jgi:hypothetical protein
LLIILGDRPTTSIGLVRIPARRDDELELVVEILSPTHNFHA